MSEQFEVSVASGSLRSSSPDAVQFAHRWTDAGVTVESPFTGAHLLHLATAGCVLNDVHREAIALGLAVGGVQVRARGSFDTQTWESHGISYEVQVDSPASDDEIAGLLQRVDDVAEIPRAIRAGAPVTRT